MYYYCGGRLVRHGRWPNLNYVRELFSKTGQWDPKFSKEVRQEIEAHWKDKMNVRHGNGGQSNITDKNKYYVLSMFPYPSGKLHMGHVRVYAISDTMARYHRLNGKDVIHPMGWDAFGLPAENAAIEKGEQPDKWTNSNITSMKKQLEALCCSFDWDRELTTSDPKYYRWTQFIFLKMFEAGLAYQKEGLVNWDPVDKTVLADEQIDEQGRSWRSGAVVEKKYLKQWYIRTTAYSKSLLDGTNQVNADLWKDVISLQRHWIGECNGVRFQFNLENKNGEAIAPSSFLSVFTKHPYAVYGVSHIALSPAHFLNNEKYYTKNNQSTIPESDVIELNVVARNPFNGQRIPIYVLSSRDYGEHLDSHVGIPSCDASDQHFANQHGLVWTKVIDEISDQLVNSGEFSGMSKTEAFTAVTGKAKEVVIDNQSHQSTHPSSKTPRIQCIGQLCTTIFGGIYSLPSLLPLHVLNCGGHVTSERARDWLISRQRYWGTPIPVIHCPTHGAVAVPADELPVRLPCTSEIKGREGGVSPLSNAQQWLTAKCPKCGSVGRRETDTMDTFVDSAWYYLRYLDVNNEREPFSRDAASRFMPVDLYIGGKEHATLHLYYARFFSHFLYDIGLVPTREPFVNLLTQGMVMGQSYRLKASNKYLPVCDVDLTGKKPVQRDTNAALIVEWEKMSKSKYNGIDPQMVLDEYGTDSTRLCILSNVAPKTDRPWSNDVFVGVIRWQARVWNLVSDFIAKKNVSSSATNPLGISRPPPADPAGEKSLLLFEQDLRNSRNICVLEVTYHMNTSFLINTSISRLQMLTNTLKKVSPEMIVSSQQYERALSDLIIMIAPFAPMFASELWAGLSSVTTRSASGVDTGTSVFEQRWPTVDKDYRIAMAVKVNGRGVYDVTLPMLYNETKSLTKSAAIELAERHDLFATSIAGRRRVYTNFQIFGSLKVELDFEVEAEKKKKQKKTQRDEAVS